MLLRRVVASAILGATLASHALAHEFWIEPQTFQVETGAELRADLRNGQNFSGIALAYFEKRTTRFDMIRDGVAEPVRGRMGDVPALQTDAGADGLVVVVHETVPSDLTYTEWQKFADFAAHKDFPDIRARHLARGLPEANFIESYTRHAKALVAVGTGAGQDLRAGLATEFVAGANPYTDPMDEGLPVQLFYGNAPRGNVQVEVFERAPDKKVTVFLLRTDADGRTTVPVRPGHAYLLDAVVLRPAPEGSAAVWETLWAALTFAVP